MALETKLNTIPERRIWEEEVCLENPIEKGLAMKKIEASDPRRAKIIFPLPFRMPDNPIEIQIATPTKAPPDTPKVYGSTRGLRKTVCIMIPEAPRRAPTDNAIRVRGRRSSEKMIYSTLSEFREEIFSN